MTVKELIIELQKIKNQDRLVVLQKDPEGNGYHKLMGIDDNAVYDKEYREVQLERLTKDLKDEGFSEEDLGSDDMEKALVLFP